MQLNVKKRADNLYNPHKPYRTKNNHETNIVFDFAGLIRHCGSAVVRSGSGARADLRGLKLGEPLAQFKKRFPQAHDTTAALEKRETEEGGIHLFANEHPLGKDINYAFLIYQDRKISDINLFIHYNKRKPFAARVEQAKKQFRLPEKGWQAFDNGQQFYRCQDYEWILTEQFKSDGTHILSISLNKVAGK